MQFDASGTTVILGDERGHVRRPFLYVAFSFEVTWSPDLKTNKRQSQLLCVLYHAVKARSFLWSEKIYTQLYRPLYLALLPESSLGRARSRRHVRQRVPLRRRLVPLRLATYAFDCTPFDC